MHAVALGVPVLSYDVVRSRLRCFLSLGCILLYTSSVVSLFFSKTEEKKVFKKERFRPKIESSNRGDAKKA
jgi:hypothetical protein